MPGPRAVLVDQRGLGVRDARVGGQVVDDELAQVLRVGARRPRRGSRSTPVRWKTDRTPGSPRTARVKARSPRGRGRPGARRPSPAAGGRARRGRPRRGSRARRRARAATRTAPGASRGRCRRARRARLLVIRASSARAPRGSRGRCRRAAAVHRSARAHHTRMSRRICDDMRPCIRRICGRAALSAARCFTLWRMSDDRHPRRHQGLDPRCDRRHAARAPRRASAPA